MFLIPSKNLIALGSMPALIFYSEKIEALMDGNPRFRINAEDLRKTRNWMDALKKANFCQFRYHRDTGEYEILPPEDDYHNMASEWIQKTNRLDSTLLESYPKFGAAQYVHLRQTNQGLPDFDDRLTSSLLSAKMANVPSKSIMSWISNGMKHKDRSKTENQEDGGMDLWKSLLDQSKKKTQKYKS